MEEEGRGREGKREKKNSLNNKNENTCFKRFFSKLGRDKLNIKRMWEKLNNLAEGSAGQITLEEYKIV